MSEKSLPTVLVEVQRLVDEMKSNSYVTRDYLASVIRQEYNLPTQRVKLFVQNIPVVQLDGLFHYRMKNVLEVCSRSLNCMIVGPAGSGKTSLAAQVAAALELDFFATGAVDSPYKLSGFIDAGGKYQRTAFRRAFEDGGLFLFDEIDASSANALMFFNAALSNDWCDFPDGMVKKSNNFRVIAAANTFGTGRDRMYVGRNQLDAATLDRFVTIDIDYDEALERKLAGDDVWVDIVQTIRKIVFKNKLRVVVSPRASMQGAHLVDLGWELRDVLSATVLRGVSPSDRTTIAAAVDHSLAEAIR